MNGIDVYYKPHKFAKSVVKLSDLSTSVKLPSGCNINHWLSTHTIDFYNIINIVRGTLTEFCTPLTCPVMCAGSRYEYLWKDDKQYYKAVKVSAPEYIDLLMLWIESQINDEHIFPSEEHNPYPDNFIIIVRNIFKKLFRVFAHIYYSHITMIRELQMELYFNTSFNHFMMFIWEFDLVSKKEMLPLYDLIINLMGDIGLKKMNNRHIGYIFRDSLSDPKNTNKYNGYD